MRRKAGAAALVAAMLLAGGLAHAAEPTIELEPMQPNLDDKPSLQRGMRLFMNYCIGCHSLKFQRYERTADDLGIPHQVALDNLIFTGQAIGGLMQSAIPQESAKSWFGGPPPDLTMVDRVRGTEWVYNMLKNFYLDPTRPFGVNNRVFEGIGMPHALIGLQGVPRLVERRPKALDLLAGDPLSDGELVPAGGDGRQRLVPNRKNEILEVAPGTGALSAEEYDQAAYDIANFLHYVGEPGRQRRQEIGVWVLAFLAGLFVLATLLNREYWKDIH